MAALAGRIKLLLQHRHLSSFQRMDLQARVRPPPAAIVVCCQFWLSLPFCPRRQQRCDHTKFSTRVLLNLVLLYQQLLVLNLVVVLLNLVYYSYQIFESTKFSTKFRILKYTQVLEQSKCIPSCFKIQPQYSCMLYCDFGCLHSRENIYFMYKTTKFSKYSTKTICCKILHNVSIKKINKMFVCIQLWSLEF